MKPVIIILTILLLSCCTEQKKYNRLTIYDEVLEQLFMKEYYYYFIEPNAYALRMDSLYWIRKISDDRYRKILFDFRDRGIRSGKTCQVDYLDSLTASYSYTKDEFTSYFLNDSTNTIKANFKDQPLNELASTLFTKADLQLLILKVNSSGLINTKRNENTYGVMMCLSSPFPRSISRNLKLTPLSIFNTSVEENAGADGCYN